jgi:hypothetical protein
MARGQDWSDQGISPDEKNPALGTRHREPANKGVVEAAGVCGGAASANRVAGQNFSSVGDMEGYVSQQALFFLNQQWMEGSSASLHNPAYLSAHLNCREEERHPPTRGCARQL